MVEHDNKYNNRYNNNHDNNHSDKYDKYNKIETCFISPFI